MPSPALASSGNSDKIQWIVGARALAICAVVLIHVSDCIVWDTDWLGVRPAWWWIGNIFSALATGGVGIFTMISGALLLAPERNPSSARFFKRRFLRIVPPYLLWSALYFAWRIFVEREELDWSQFPAAVLDGGAYYHLWFMLMIVEIYLLTPPLRWLVTHVSRTPLLGGLLVCFIWKSALPTIQHALVQEEWGANEPVAVAYLGYVGYFVLGHVLGGIALSPRGMAVVVCAWLAGVGSTAWMTYRATVAAGGTLSEEWGDHNFYPYVVLLAVAAFLLLRNLPWESMLEQRPWRWLIPAISASSFTIYLCHPILVELHWYSFSPVPLHAAWIHPLAGIPLTALFALAGCIAFAFGVRAILRGKLRPLASVIAP